MTPARSWTRNWPASVRRLRPVVVVCTRARRWDSRSVRCCMRARIREARSAGRVCGSCILYSTCVAAAPVISPLPSSRFFLFLFLFFFFGHRFPSSSSHSQSHAGSSVASFQLPTCLFVFSLAETFLISFFSFCVILSIVMHFVRGTRGRG
jgi:hypothetical protein